MSTPRQTTRPPPAGPIDPALGTACRRVIEGALAIVPGEAVLFVIDRDHADVGEALANAALARMAWPTTIVLEDLGSRPFSGLPREVRDAMENTQASVLLIDIARHPEIPLRHEMINAAGSLGLRHAHLIGLSRRALIAGMMADPVRVAEATRSVRGKIQPTSRLALRSRAGSNLEVQLDPRYRWKLQAGNIRSGHWENLPSGLLLTHPGSVRGTFVADACIMGRFAGREGLLSSVPVRFEIEGSVVREVKCSDFAFGQEIQRYLGSEVYLERVGSVILGTNVGLSSPLGELLHDQCLPGMHLVFGYTHREETGAPFCSRGILSVTGAYADVDVDGAALVRGGRFI